MITVITGNGKGKTTSALGGAMSAAMAGRRVYVGQFMKAGDYSEIAMLKSAFPEIVIEQFDGGMLINRAAKDNDRAAAQDGAARAMAAMASGKYDLIVLDELNVVLFLELIDMGQAMKLMDDAKKSGTDLILTGRYAAPEVLQRADAAYELLQIKHYFNDGVPARKGIEM
ncbi:MAG: cob(I)yrinic acid a,c-diamide adenosyltransferase [Clostridiales bacterium]|jgi:cob(I)alamin adenosyltransferase|nr:cob(I)yrinic acid a,c-diamide adenosyltransferase [Clostridiales bacterium]